MVYNWIVFVAGGLEKVEDSVYGAKTKKEITTFIKCIHQLFKTLAF
jgi:hypothetical protein